MLFKSAILRLTVFYVLIVMVISIGFSIVLYNLYSHEFGQGLGRQTTFLRQAPVNCSAPWPIQDLERIKNEQLNLSNAHLKTNLVYFNGLIFLLSALFSYFFAKKTLSPIEDMVIAQRRFTADASHELKTPLTAMKTEIEVSLRDKKISREEALVLLRSNLEEIAKLESLSTALLNLAKYEEDEKKEFDKVSLSSVITDAYAAIEANAKKKKITFSNQIKETLILADPKSLKELFVILFDNAIKYSPVGSKIFLNSKKTDGHIAVFIKDQGCGIAKEDLAHIFDRFYRVDQSRCKDKTPGYGLGLAIAKNIAKIHKAEISVKSEIGKGSTFIITLPKIKKF